MIDKEVLEKAIEKAVKNGWTVFKKIGKDMFRYEIESEELVVHWYDTPTQKGFFPSQHVKSYSVNDVIFSHDFAKAFWGTEKSGNGLEWWQWYLQQMVLEENRLQYLKKFL